MDKRREWLTTAEVARELGVSAARVRQWIMSGELPSEKAGGSRLIHRDAVEPFRTRKTTPGPAPTTGARARRRKAPPATP